MREQTAGTGTLLPLSPLQSYGEWERVIFPLVYSQEQKISPNFFGDLFPAFLGLPPDPAIRPSPASAKSVDLENRSFLIGDPQQHWYVPLSDHNLV